MRVAVAIDREAPYQLRQRAHDQDYRDAYGAWTGSLPADEYLKLELLGLEGAHMPGRSGAAPHGDLAELPLACCNPLALDDDEPPEESERSGTLEAEGVHDLLRRLVGEVMSKDNARLSLECLALVTGLAYCGDSMTDIARRHGVSRAAVSKRCVELTTALNLKPSRAMRSADARERHRQARLDHLQNLS